MHPSQAINPQNALVYASFDRMWVESAEGWTVAGNNGGAATPDYIYMGPGTSQPRQITEERGIALSGGQYAFTRLSFDAGTPFSIAVLSDSAMAAAGWLAATFDSVANVGVRFGASAAGTLVAELRNAGGSIVQTAALPSNAGREKRLYILTYDGSGTTGGLKLHVDDRTLASVASGTTVMGSLDSGRVLTIGSQTSASGFLVGKIFGIAAYPFELNEAMRFTLRGRMLRETKASAAAVYGSFQVANVPADIKLASVSGCRWLWFSEDSTLTTGKVSLVSARVGPNLEQGTDARRPVVAAAAELNGKPALQFSGAQMMSSVADLDLSAHTSMTFVVVFKDSSAAASIVVEHGPNASTSNGFYLAVNDSSATQTTVSLRATLQDRAFFLYDNSAYQNYEWELDTTLGNPGEILARMTGVPKTVVHGTSGNASGNLISGLVHVGARTGLVAPIIGHIVMCAVYAPKLAGANLAAMRAALAEYTGLSA